MTMHSKWIRLALLVVVMAASGCGQIQRSFAVASMQQIDSLLLTRHAGYWEDLVPLDDRILGYEVLVAKTGRVRFEPLGSEKGRARSFTIDRDSVQVLFEVATRLDFEDGPVSLIGMDPWCDVSDTDASDLRPGPSAPERSVGISIYRGGHVDQVTDYHGCSEDGDESTEQLISQLRGLERDATRLFELESRFNAAPFIRLDSLLGLRHSSPIGALITFVREDVRRQVPPEMKPYEVGLIFLKVQSGASARDPLASLDHSDLQRLDVMLVNDWHWTDVLIEDAMGGNHVRDEGVYVSVSSIKRIDSTDPSEEALEMTFNYYVTFRRPGRRPGICLLEWRIEVVQKALGPGEEGWEVVETKNLGIC